ncbi:hypothetical protein Tco_0717340, partial [Tanacetum coccineum]
GFNPLVHSFRALSTLRRFGLRTASAAGETLSRRFFRSLPEAVFILINGEPWNPDGCSCWPETRQFTTPCSYFIFLIKDILIAERHTAQLS